MTGELKRRLIELMEEGNFEYIGAAESIIDECCKEFPLPFDVLASMGKTIWDSPDTQWKKETMEWFVKWLTGAKNDKDFLCLDCDNRLLPVWRFCPKCGKETGR